MALLCGVLFFFGYSIPNHFHLFEPQLLQLTTLDKAVPFLPWTIYVYTSEYCLFVSAYFLFSDEHTRNKYVWAYCGVLLVGAFFFVFYPTTYPRADYPLPADLGALTNAVWVWLRTVDNPSNCFPSMHVTCCYLTAFAFLSKNESKLKFWIYFIWSTFVALSTLPTKQHYLIDVVGGLALAVGGYWFFFKVAKYEPMADYIARFRTISRAS